MFVFQCAGNIQRDEVIPQPEAAQLRPVHGRRPGEACVWPAPSVPGLGGSNLLSYVYRLGSSAVAHSDYITLMRRQEQWSGGVRLLVTINMEIKTSLHPFNVSISLQISSLM